MPPLTLGERLISDNNGFLASHHPFDKLRVKLGFTASK